MPRPHAAEHAVAQIDDPKIVDVDADRGNEKSAGPAQRGGKHGAARAAFLNPAAEHCGRDAEHEDRDAEKIQPSWVSFQSSGADWRDAEQAWSSAG